MAIRVGINGFGRMGRNFFRAVQSRETDIEIVCINDLADAHVLAYMIKYDSVLGRLNAEVTSDAESFSVGGTRVKTVKETDPSRLPWKELNVDIVLESTGKFTNAQDARGHLAAGAKRVVISAPATNEDITIVMGVNNKEYKPEKHFIVSNASCTTNCVAPMAKVLLDDFGIVSAYMTTIHAYTTEQQLLDQISTTRSGGVNLRRMRAAAINIVPTTTGAAKAIGLVLPVLKGKIDGLAFRAPVPTGSVIDLVATLEKSVAKADVNSAFKRASENGLRGVLDYTDDEVVSSDILHHPASCIFDSTLSMVMGNKVKVIGWYDNEWGYSNRLIDLICFMGR